MWKGIMQLVEQIKQCENAGATTAALALTFICFDTMSFLALPAGKEKQGRSDFVEWTDLYLRGHPDQIYQYDGIDVYGARCALLHAFGSEVDFHQNNPDAKIFGYHDGGRHAYNSEINPRLVIIGTASFFNDAVHAVTSFIEKCAEDADLRSRVEARLPRVLATLPIQA